jgi:PIN domain nuclease of toxin-antitoxin system
MRVLLDTNAFIWLSDSPEQLPQAIRQILEDARSQLLVSIATPWEIAIKKSIGKLKTRHTAQQFITTYEDIIEFLPIQADHLAIIETLPLHHRDPFDRIIIAQAITENIPVVSSDEAFDDYSVERIWD